MLKEEEGTSKRVYGLDIMRALAILPVVLIHACTFLQKIDTNYPWVQLYEGVDVFFVLSGFLIGTILIKTFVNTPDYNFNSIISFLKRRWFRTLPNYFLILLINVILVYFGIIGGDIHQFGIKFLFFCQNFLYPFTDFFWESWSLTIEEWFYVLFPIILMLLFILFRKKVNRKYVFLAATIIFLTFPVLLRIYRGLHMTVDFGTWELYFKKITLFRLDSIGWGILAAYIKFYHEAIFYRFKNVLFLAGIALLVWVYKQGGSINEFYNKVFQLSVMDIAIVLTVPKFDSIKHGKGIVAKIITHISKISYSMYLINLGLIAEVIYTQAPPTTVRGAIVAYVVYWVSLIALSSIIYRYYEKPIMDLRDRRK